MTGLFGKLVAGLMCLSLAGCGIFGGGGGGGGFLGLGGLFGNRSASEQGLPFRAQLRRGEDRRNFTVTVRAGGQSVDAVRESVRFPATQYCLLTFGLSDVDWVINPATGDWAFERSGEDMIFQGRCTAR